MSQTIQGPRVVTLAKGVDTTQAFDPDETVPFPTAALMAAMDAAAAEQPPMDPARDAVLRAHMVATRILREAPLPDGIRTLHALSELTKACVEVMLHRDRDRSRMEGYRALYGGEITHREFEDVEPDTMHSELLLTIDDVAVRVWTLAPITAAVAA